MNMTHERIIKNVLGGMAAEAPPALEYEELGTPLAHPRNHGGRPGWPRGRLAALGLAAFAGVIAVGALVFFAVGRSEVADSPPEAVGSPVAVTQDEFDAVVRPAVESLLEAPGFRGLQSSFVEGFLAVSVWLDARPNGDFVVVQSRDLDVLESAWWMVGEEPPATGRRIATSVTVRVGDAIYDATAVGDDLSAWSQRERDRVVARGTLGFEIALLSEQHGVAQLLSETTALTRQGTSDGGSVWAATVPYDDGNAVLRWGVQPDGRLGYASGELVGVSRPGVTEPTGPTDAWQIQFASLEDPEPITAPDLGAPLDISGFDLPEGFPLPN